MKSSPALVAFALLCFAGVAFAGNPLYFFCCLLTFFLLILLVWKNTSPGILLFSVLVQWAQVIAFVIWMNTLGWDINRISPHGGIAVIFSCLGLLVMAVTFNLGLRKVRLPSIEQFRQQAKLINERKILTLYLFSTVFMSGAGLAFSGAGGLTQILMTFSSVKWVFFMTYAYVVWINKKNRFILVVIVLFEFVTSLYSFFPASGKSRFLRSWWQWPLCAGSTLSRSSMVWWPCRPSFFLHDLDSHQGGLPAVS
ncbi:hypothetical protein ACQ86N_42565 [Puia sp. P3]|uniref:hypothetical protein n=1 Tax=Puia sp. P3 TaxID=3423952 RepID=UPI003D67EE5A